MTYYQEKLEKVLRECDKHILRIEHATKKMSAFMPLDSKKYQNLTDDEVEHIDQFLFRFAKLQDAMGRKLFKLVLILKDDLDIDEVETMSFIDILNRLEKLKLIDAHIWRSLRDDRNELAHNYDDNAEESSIIINKLFEKRIELFKIYSNIKNYL